jgi:hypothetical protein
MKRTLLPFVFLCCLHLLSAEDKFKFGNCPASLLEMDVYPKDSTASAVVVYEDCDVRYDINSVTADFEVITEYVVRIKILTQEGIEYASGSVPFYKGNTTASSENVSGITGWTYNLEDGKVVKEKLSKDYIFTENVTDHLKRIKFAMPAVKVGSVIEYKYSINSPHYYNLNDYKFQRSIPVQYSSFRIKIPEYFIFSRETKGYEPINVTIKPANQTLSIKGKMTSCSAEEIFVEAENIPALKADDYVWNYRDFMSGINFELKKVNFTGVYYKDYTQTWSKIVERLNDDDDFGKTLKEKGILKNELPSVLADKSADTDSIRAILNLVRSKVKWNDRSTLWVGNMNKALKDGSGSSGEINAILLNALKNAGFEVYPVAMSLRSRGRIPLTYPSIDNLNYFIVCVYSGTSVYYLDATRSYTDINIIPIDCLVDKALVVYPQSFDWIDLTSIGNNSNRISLAVKFNDEGILSGKKSEVYFGELAYAFKRDFDGADNQDKYIESEESHNNITISDYAMAARENPNFNFTESYEFTDNTIQLGEEVISFNPLLFLAMKNNAFKSETRVLPVEFSYPYEQRINVTITLPEGYVTDELPTSERFVFGDDSRIDFSYVVQATENNIQLAYKIKLGTCIIPATEYGILRDFWAKMHNKENELITIKKVNNN